MHSIKHKTYEEYAFHVLSCMSSVSCTRDDRRFPGVCLKTGRWRLINHISMAFIISSFGCCLRGSLASFRTLHNLRGQQISALLRAGRSDDDLHRENSVDDHPCTLLQLCIRRSCYGCLAWSIYPVQRGSF